MVTGSDLSQSLQAIDLARQYPGQCYATVGVHPCSARAFEEYEGGGEALLAELERVARAGIEEGTVVAFGEFGLDFDRLGYCDRETQEKWFAKQLEVAAKVWYLSHHVFILPLAHAPLSGVPLVRWEKIPSYFAIPISRNSLPSSINQNSPKESPTDHPPNPTAPPPPLPPLPRRPPRLPKTRPPPPPSPLPSLPLHLHPIPPLPRSRPLLHRHPPRTPLPPRPKLPHRPQRLLAQNPRQPRHRQGNPAREPAARDGWAVVRNQAFACGCCGAWRGVGGEGGERWERGGGEGGGGEVEESEKGEVGGRVYGQGAERTVRDCEGGEGCGGGEGAGGSGGGGGGVEEFGGNVWVGGEVERERDS